MGLLTTAARPLSAGLYGQTVFLYSDLSACALWRFQKPFSPSSHSGRHASAGKKMLGTQRPQLGHGVEVARGRGDLELALDKVVIGFQVTVLGGAQDIGHVTDHLH